MNPRRYGRRVWLAVAAGTLAVTLLAAAAIYLSLPDVSSLKKRNPRSTALMEQRRREAERAGTRYSIRQQWVALDAVPLLLRQAVRVSEDASFYQHGGVDFFELKESLKRNLMERHIVRGGSTITQQLAKNLYLSTSRSPLRKIREYFIARSLEEHLSKDRILELYLNVIELGPGIFGVEAASRHWFGKPAAALGPGEIVRLTAIIPRPLAVSPLDDTRGFRWRARWITDLLKAYGYITEDVYQEVGKAFRH